ncbi:hypothetical protein ACFQ1B_36320 [Streptomyces mexicanus]
MYDSLIAQADVITEATALPAAARADVDWRLCHIALADRIIAAAAREQIDQGTATVDNQPSMDPDRIKHMTRSTTHAQRVDNVRRNWAELRSLLARFSPADAQAQLTLRMHDRNGEYVSDSVLTWSELIEMRATRHIPGHRDALAQAVRPASRQAH